MRCRISRQPVIVHGDMVPGIKACAHHRRDLGLGEIFGFKTDDFALFDRQGVMIHAGARIVDQLVAFVFPNDAFDFQRRAALDVAPAVAPVAGIKRILNDVKAPALQRQAARQENS